MDFSDLHFENANTLWIGAAVPLFWLLFFLFYRLKEPAHQLEKFIDPHLLPYLLKKNPKKKKSFWITLIFWSVAWLSLTLALAGPRWNFREIETFSKDQSLVILLDLSDSMNAEDLKPTRLIRGKQKIEDLLNLSKGVKIGLIGFAADAHMLSPITEDKETIRHLLPYIGSDLVYVQGSRLTPALEMAEAMLSAEPGRNKALLIISDGGFEDASALLSSKKLSEKEIVIHTMGVGTKEGAFFNKKGKSIHSKLEMEKLREVSHMGKGHYFEPHYSSQNEALILEELEKKGEAEVNIGRKEKLWDERFYLALFLAIPIFMAWFRRGFIFAAFLFLMPLNVEAAFSDCFKNSEEIGKEALENEDFEKALSHFQDPYRKGVAHYRAKEFAKAEKMFRESQREEVRKDAAYNLANSLAMQMKLKEAITAYEEVLEEWPDHIKAKENLEIVKKMLESQDSKNDSKSESDNSDEHEQNQDKQDSEKNPGNNSDKQSDENNNKENFEDRKNDESQDESKDENQSKEEFEKEEPTDSEPKEQNERPNDERPRELKRAKDEQDQEADQWLNRMTSDPKMFLKNKFYIESMKNGTKEGIDPW